MEEKISSSIFLFSVQFWMQSYFPGKDEWNLALSNLSKDYEKKKFISLDRMMPALKSSHTLLWSEMSGQNLCSSHCGHGGLWPAPAQNPFHTSGKQSQEQVFITNEDKSINTLDNKNIVISQKKATAFILRVHIIHIHVFPADFWWAHTSPSLSQQHCNNNKPTANY